MNKYKAVYTKELFDKFLSCEYAILIPVDKYERLYLMRMLEKLGVKWHNGHTMSERKDKKWLNGENNDEFGKRYIRINSEGRLTSGVVSEFNRIPIQCELIQINCSDSTIKVIETVSPDKSNGTPDDMPPPMPMYARHGDIARARSITFSPTASEPLERVDIAMEQAMYRPTPRPISDDYSVTVPVSALRPHQSQVFRSLIDDLCRSGFGTLGEVISNFETTDANPHLALMCAVNHPRWRELTSVLARHLIWGSGHNLLMWGNVLNDERQVLHLQQYGGEFRVSQSHRTQDGDSIFVANGETYIPLSSFMD